VDTLQRFALRRRKNQYAGDSIAPKIWANCMAQATNDRIEEIKSASESDDRKLE
jgi:uncharacterized protein YecT (DUF1311 family)